jgi:hypothetical protein
VILSAKLLKRILLSPMAWSRNIRSISGPVRSTMATPAAMRRLESSQYAVRLHFPD